METNGLTWCVTGAAGRIGRVLRAHLSERGVPTVSLDVTECAPVGPEDRVLHCDLRHLPELVAALRGCSGVVHLGGLPDEADFHELADVNVVGTYHVLEAARRAGSSRVVFASSNRVTGSYPVSETVTPSDPPRPDGFYGVSKVAGESLCRLYADKFGLSTISVRIGSFKERPEDVRHARTWLSHADALRAFDAAMATEAHSAVFYAVSRNSERWWSLEEGEQLGFVPRDDAATFIGLGALAPDTPQGGPYAGPAHSLGRMRG
ncbi:NAD-dependent epimerase/dehydratase family protein [Nocardiopsis kunsanensis]|uniref:NAD-dependent epimerase/dehydratase family protein n=1 Tax=Nocardiopsis kunsanensis TaxID=141693 RepID=UPI0018749DC3|nr:NAD-dependent epimerase/dehydratase family protein [Nocardiopsis kunsanensis]